MPRSYEYSKPMFFTEQEREEFEFPVCPHCKSAIDEGDSVHLYDGVVWHTKPCP